MPRMFVLPKWFRDPRVPDWFRVFYRNAWGMTRMVFKRNGLRKQRPAFKRFIWKPLMRLPVSRHLNWVKRHLRKNIKHSLQGSDGKSMLLSFGRLLYSYWYPWQQGKHILGRRGPLMPIRITGFTSQGEEYWHNKSRPGSQAHKTDLRSYRMPVSQAKQILDIGPHNFYPRVVDRNFARIFLANQVSNGGSWYIVARIFCAKRVLDRELAYMGIRDPPHLRPTTENFKVKDTFKQWTSEAEDHVRPPKYNPVPPGSGPGGEFDPQWAAQRAKADWQHTSATDPRRSSVNRRKSSVDPSHGKKFGFSTLANPAAVTFGVNSSRVLHGNGVFIQQRRVYGFKKDHYQLFNSADAYAGTLDYDIARSSFATTKTPTTVKKSLPKPTESFFKSTTAMFVPMITLNTSKPRKELI